MTTAQQNYINALAVRVAVLQFKLMDTNLTTEQRDNLTLELQCVNKVIDVVKTQQA